MGSSLVFSWERVHVGVMRRSEEDVGADINSGISLIAAIASFAGYEDVDWG